MKQIEQLSGYGFLQAAERSDEIKKGLEDAAAEIQAAIADTKNDKASETI